jgi:hypothetical protein
MKYNPFFCLLLSLFCCRDAYSQTTKTIHQTFTLDDANNVDINVVGKNIEIRETKGSRVLVEITIQISEPNERLLDFLINSGRYNLDKNLDLTQGKLKIASKRTNNVVMVKGKECYEQLSYIFYVPVAIKYVNNSTTEEDKRE